MFDSNDKNRSRIYKHRFLIFLLAFCMLSQILPASAKTNSDVKNTNEDNLVRVGWFDSMFSYHDALGRREGYAYDYIQKIVAYTGWKVEYVEGTWTELYEMVEKGEIDVLGSVCETEERDKIMLFSDHAMGTENYYVFVRTDNKEIKEDDFTSLNGKVVAVEAKTIQVDVFKEWQKKNNVSSDLREMSLTYEQQVSMLKSGEIDALVSTDSFSTYIADCYPIFSIGSNDYRFAINKNRPEIKTQLDYAITQILRLNKYYNYDLDKKYMTGAELSGYLNQADVEWLNNHGKIRIGYDKENLPYSFLNSETGEASGFISDFMQLTNEFLKNVEIEYEPVAYDNINSLIDALKHGEIDVIFPARLGSYEAEKNGILITDFIGDTEYVVIVKTENIEKFDYNAANKVAIKKNDINSRSTMLNHYTNWIPVEYNDYDSGIAAVADGTADCMYIDSYKKALIEEKLRDNNLSAFSTGITTGVSFAVNPNDIPLYSLFNILSHMIPKVEINTILIKYSYSEKNITLVDFIKDNLILVLLFIGMIFLIILSLLLQSFYLAKKEKRAAEMAEAANYAKTSFLFNMSHDIRTPMNAIMGFRDLLEKNQDNPELRADYLNKIKESSSVLLSIINNVLEMARIEKGTLTLNETAINTPLLQDSLYSMFNEMMQKKNITLERELHYKHPYIYVDPNKSRDIFINILSNAYKYTNPGGTVKMLTEEFPSEKEGYVWIRTTISDTGIGMSEDFLPKIFTEFSRESGVNTDKIEGTGLGMPIVKRLVDFLGGTIEVKSKKGEGSSFAVTLPHRIAEKADMDISSGSIANIEDLAGKHILLAEDNDINAEISMTLLTELGFIVERAKDGRICVEKYLEHPDKYDLILMDVQMPNMNGYEATKVIRDTEETRTKPIPILAMTANAFEEDKKNAMSAGMNGHISKPVDIAELTREISRILSQ